MAEKCCAVIVAAGNSIRMGKAKPFIELFDKKALEWTFAAFEKAKYIDSIVVVVRPEDEEEIRKMAASQTTKKISFVYGGKTRQQSAAAGAQAAGECIWLAIHDGARCLITAEEIDGVIMDAENYGASVLAVPVKDTIKVADDKGMIMNTPDRSILWSVQTPQVFPASTYKSEIEKALQDGREYTDDCQLWEYLGKPIHLFRGNYTNLKLTTAEDILFAESILRNRGADI